MLVDIRLSLAPVEKPPVTDETSAANAPQTDLKVKEKGSYVVVGDSVSTTPASSVGSANTKGKTTADFGLSQSRKLETTVTKARRLSCSYVWKGEDIFRSCPPIL